MRSKLRCARTRYPGGARGRRACWVSRAARRPRVGRELVVGLAVVASVTVMAVHAALGGWCTAAAQDAPRAGVDTAAGSSASPLDASVEAHRAQNRALQSATITADDLPIDAAGRSAKTGQVIPGLRPRGVIPADVGQALGGLQARATNAAGSLPSESESVVITDLANDPARRARIDDAAPNAQPVAPVERNR